MFIYQTHIRTSQYTCESGYPSLLHIISYELGTSKEEVLSKIGRTSELCEIYVLKVSEDTLRDEIVHCEEMVHYWESLNAEFHKEVIKRQRKLIQYYVDMILKSREY